MGLAMIGNIGQYTKTMKMTMDWKQKKESGNYTKKSDEKTSELDFYRRQLEDIRENAKDDKSTIYMKLKSGKKLTAEELEYLRDHDPEAYKEAKEIEEEQERYEEELKRCKTKEDVDALKMTYLSSKMAVAKEISNNPNIPEGAKMQLLLKENAKIKAVQEVDIKFRNSAQYANLPTAEEKAEETEEKRAQLRGEQEQEEGANRTEEENQGESGDESEKGQVSGEAKTQEATHVPEAEKEIHWIDLREAAKSPKAEREYVHETYRKELEWETKTEPKDKNRGRH